MATLRKGDEIMGYAKGIHHVAIKVKDFDKTCALYTHVFGMTPTLSWGEGDNRAVMLDCGDGACIEVFAGGKGKLSEGAWMHIALKVTDVDGAYAAALKAGCVAHMEPKSIDIESKPCIVPVRIAFVKGFDGEIIEFFANR